MLRSTNLLWKINSRKNAQEEWLFKLIRCFIFPVLSSYNMCVNPGYNFLMFINIIHIFIDFLVL